VRRCAVVTCAVVQVCNEMSGQEADQVERRRNSGVERENHVVTCQHRGELSAVYSVLLSVICVHAVLTGHS